MHKQYLHFFEDIDESLQRNIGDIEIIFKIIGFVALSLAGLPERGTKDVDTLRAGKLETLSDPLVKQALDFLTKGFGKDSPGAFRHGMYLDFVSNSVPWLPPNHISSENMISIILRSID